MFHISLLFTFVSLVLYSPLYYIKEWKNIALSGIELFVTLNYHFIGHANYVEDVYMSK